MKTLIWALAASVLILFVGCQVPFGGTGSLKVALPAPARAVASSDGKGNTARLQVLRNGIILPIEGKDYKEAALAGQVITIDGLPSGSGYTLNLATGEKKAGGYFEVAYFQTSASFEISAGVDTAVNVTLKPTPVQLLAFGAAPNKAIAVSNGSSEDLVVVSGTSAYQLSTQPDWSAQNPGLPAAFATLAASEASWGLRTLNSLGLTYDTAGNADVSFNSDDGLGTWGGASFDFAMTNDSAEAIHPNVKKSGSFVYNSGNTYRFQYYAGNGLTAGLAVTEDADPVEWKDLESLLEVDSLPSSVRDSLQKSDGLIRDFATTDNFAYLSTALGVYRVDVMTISGNTTQRIADMFTDDANTSMRIAVKLNGSPVSIGPVSASFDGSSTGRVYAGTAKGLFSKATNGYGLPDGGYDSLTLVSGTFGLNITKLETVTFNNANYTAALSASTNEVLVLKDTGSGPSLIKRIPALAGLPSGDLTVGWWDETKDDYDHTLKLVVSGSDGTVLVDLDSYTEPN